MTIVKSFNESATEIAMLLNQIVGLNEGEQALELIIRPGDIIARCQGFVEKGGTLEEALRSMANQIHWSREQKAQAVTLERAEVEWAAERA